jgi:hypothetical protein
MKRLSIYQTAVKRHTMSSHMQHPNDHSRQQGLVSILTVLMFSILIAVLLAGFTRLMLQEQQDTLKDDLSKSAYNSAQAGVEDAKRAIRHCAANPEQQTATIDCKVGLYNDKCPGFNAPTTAAPGGAFVGLGIKPPATSGTTVGEPGANQRYTCVIIGPSPDIVAELGGSDSTTNTGMYELTGATAYDKIEVSWHARSVDYALPTRLTVLNTTSGKEGNVRQSDWKNSSDVLYPAVLRTTVLAAPATITPATISQRHVFLYPTIDSPSAGDVPASGAPSWYINCSTGTSSTYACTATLDVSVAPLAQERRYILVQPLYRATTVSIKLKNSITGLYVPVKGEQVTIDATGAAASLFRRVQVRVKVGSPIATSTALDADVCKDFFLSADNFIDNCN